MFHRFSGALVGAALALTVFGTVAFAEPAPPCQTAHVSVAGGKPQTACLTQQGSTIVIVLDAQPAAEPDMSAITDTRVDTYAKRQALRDQYQGRIDVVTFNDELGDGVPLDQALADAMHAFNMQHS